MKNQKKYTKNIKAQKTGVFTASFYRNMRAFTRKCVNLTCTTLGCFFCVAALGSATMGAFFFSLIKR